ncbi:hypothetical protein GW17_00039630 [Ensete ventricosum]|nr:hypothetical protein GW17_00039630 [Ensete ventricosum]
MWGMIAWSIPAMAWTWLASPRKALEVTTKLLRLGAGKVSPRSLNRRQYFAGVWMTGFPSPNKGKEGRGGVSGGG